MVEHSPSMAFRESPAVAGLRFVLELIAWIAIYFAWGVIPAVLAIAALALFSVPGDKHLVLVRVPGAVRIALELAVAAAGIFGAWRIGVLRGQPAVGLGVALGLLAAHIVLLMLSYRRWVWMTSTR